MKKLVKIMLICVFQMVVGGIVGLGLLALIGGGIALLEAHLSLAIGLGILVLFLTFKEFQNADKYDQ